MTLGEEASRSIQAVWGLLRRDPGAASAFNATLDLSAFPPGNIRIEISDLSAADGSVLALDSVEVVVR